MSYTIYWNLFETPCGVFVDCNLKVDEYTSGDVFLQTVIFEVTNGSGSIQVDAGHKLKMYAASINSPQYAWPSDYCNMVLHIDNGDPDEEGVISYSCGETIENYVPVNQSFTINVFSSMNDTNYIGFTYVIITPYHTENSTTSFVSFGASQMVNINVVITYQYRLAGGSWVTGQTETISNGTTYSTIASITLPFTGASVEVKITGISPLNSGLYIYRTP